METHVGVHGWFWRFYLVIHHLDGLEEVAFVFLVAVLVGHLRN